ncbi:MAG: trypsin-like peptidase domain-containing protein [Acidobacteria bacterium]|nr:trypsin-like peptidase domain-containing protein [Acidobacteriota bacterium]
MTMKFRCALLLAFLFLPAAWTTSNGQQLREAFRKVRQSVVIVRTKQVEVAPAPGQVMSVVDGLGSGVLISNDGRILTAAHVVQTADVALVVFPDGQEIEAHVIGSDVRADVALLKLDHPPAGIAPVAVGDSDKVEVGDQIFVIGAPYGLEQTLSAGHVSGRHQLDRKTESSGGVEFLQTDAAINSGNSGGPVFTMDGEVVGIVSSIMSRSGGSEGLAFATASNTAKRLLLERRPVWSGIDGLLVTGDLARALNLPQPAGVLVQRIGEGSIASRLGIQPGTLRVNVAGTDLLLGGDVILSVNGLQVTENDGSYEPILNRIGALKPGDNLVVTVLRQGQAVKLSTRIEP